MEQPIAISMRGITKSFGSVTANHNVDLDVYRGEILALLGENGSGKTTLMNMLSGIYFPDEGKTRVYGKDVIIRSPKDALELGIGMIHQHFKLIDVFTAAENIVLGLEEEGWKLDKAIINERVKNICDKYGFDIDPEEKVYDMSVSQKQTLEIVKVLYRGADILILDEPTAVLTPQEVRKLFDVIRNMRDYGKSIIIITHKLNEVLEISDRVAVLRKGENAGAIKTTEANERILTEMMVGERVDLDIERSEPVDCVERLTVEHLTCKNLEGQVVLDDINFSLYSGEILGVAGISGCGQKELLESIAGLQRVERGSISFHSPEDEETKQLVGRSPKQIKEYGIVMSFVPEDRLGMGLVGSMGMADNMMLKNYSESRSFFTKKKEPKELALRIKEELGVIAPDIDTPVRRLSGGNVQKVLVGREIASAPTVLMTAYAVRGLDINTSYTIYNLLNEQKKKGVAVLYVGEDLDVLLALCDRILVLCDGKMNGIVDARTATKEEIGMLMTNLKEDDAQ